MAIRRQRAPRPGEVLSWLSIRRRFTARPEEGKSGPQIRVSPAPCCGNGKRGGAVVINSANGFWTCFACGSKGNWYGFTRKAGDPLGDPYEDMKPVDTRIYDKIRNKLRRPVTASHHQDLLRYCTEERLITRATLDTFRVSTAGPDALRWPLVALDADGRWLIANARIRKVLNIKPDDTRDWFEVKGGPTCLAIGNHTLGLEPPLWRTERPAWAPQWLDPAPASPATAQNPFPAVRRVLITEGQWDMMTAWQVGIPNVLSLPNGASHVDVAGLLRYVPENAEVWLAVDMDDAGNRAAEAFFSQLGGGVRRLVLPHKDLNDWLRAYPPLVAEDVLATVEADVRDKPKERQWASLLEEEESEPPSPIICETPWPKLTARLGGGFRGAQTTGILAPSGAGKTTLANNILAHAALCGVTAGVIQLEGKRGDNIAKLRGQVAGWCRPDLDEDMPRYLKRILYSSLVGSQVTWEQTIKEVEAMAIEGARLIVVDNWDFIMPPDMAGERMKLQAYKKFQDLAKAYDFHGVAIWQPGKVDRAQAVNSGTQKGMSKAFQDADVYITLNKSGLNRRVEVEKARVEGVGDDVASVVMLRYNVETHCLDQSDGQADLTALATEVRKNPDDLV